MTRLAAHKKADYYSILGLDPTATPEEVKRAYRERAKSTHPDASRTADTISEFMKVKEAYETLYDAQRRSEFDRKRKIAEVTELAANVGEILATDLAIPLARDVALPLIKASIQALDKTVRGRGLLACLLVITAVCLPFHLCTNHCHPPHTTLNAHPYTYR